MICKETKLLLHSLGRYERLSVYAHSLVTDTHALSLVLLNLNMPCLCKQCRSKAVGVKN